MFEVWNKEKIISLSENKKQQWFDVLNYKLEEESKVEFDVVNSDRGEIAANVIKL